MPSLMFCKTKNTTNIIFDVLQNRRYKCHLRCFAKQKIQQMSSLMFCKTEDTTNATFAFLSFDPLIVRSKYLRPVNISFGCELCNQNKVQTIIR